MTTVRKILCAVAVPRWRALSRPSARCLARSVRRGGAARGPAPWRRRRRRRARTRPPARPRRAALGAAGGPRAGLLGPHLLAASRSAKLRTAARHPPRRRALPLPRRSRSRRAAAAANGGSASAAREGATKRVGLVVVDAAGKPIERSAVAGDGEAARAARSWCSPSSPPTPGSPPQRYGWRVLARAAAARSRRGCAQSCPAEAAEPRAFRLRPVRAVGCTGGSAGLVTNGPRDRHVVALTFDDGPSEYTTASSTCCAKRACRRPSSRSARRCRAAKRRCGGSSPKATRSATTR